ncbi:hypothetical protein BCY91_02760 [Pelobium manganitolerans]|uniref:DUF4374 domain-containing protein n=1 Tax=Pelobium manganitolerans TaxID=1842495 RepID=A0A419S7F3_9SPHI|nr:DUF4374 domain-containing protein [Pelobium manganitolerans]RKD17086.1 hypothetical protein BCY91_02760 [Pelobium manganitolerans]
MKTTFSKAIAAVAITATLASCSKDDGPKNPGNFILAVTPAASTGVADYLVTAGSLDTGKVSIIGNGLEQDGTYRYYLTTNNKFYSMLYGQGNPGAVTAYSIQQGSLVKLTNFQTETVQAFAPVNNDILLTKVPRSIGADSTVYTYYQVNTSTNTIGKRGTLDALAPANNGEIAHFSWLQQVGNKVFAPFFPIKNNSFDSDFHDQAWIAVYSYPDMKLEKTIKDDRTSFIGRYFVNGLGVVENGDVYAFSSSVSTTSDLVGDKNVKRFTDTKPSAITRIKAGSTEFDKSYYFDFEAKSGNYYITNWLYIGGGKFVAHIQPKAKKGAYTAGSELAIVDVNAQSVTKVTGLPKLEDISGLTTNNYTPKDGRTAYIGVNLANTKCYVYKIDASTATATQGVEVIGGKITAVQHLD